MIQKDLDKTDTSLQNITKYYLQHVNLQIMILQKVQLKRKWNISSKYISLNKLLIERYIAA